MTAAPSRRTAAPNIVLIGFMGTGKTAVGKIVAAKLGRPFVDTDRLIEERAGRPIPRIFAEEGEEGFRRLESEAISEVSARGGAVIATGGGVVLRAENMARLRARGRIVALRADPRAILARVGGGGERPLLGGDPEDRVGRLLEERAALYAGADLTIDTSALDVGEVVARVLEFAASPPAPGRRAAPEPASGPVPEQTVRVDLGPRGYDIQIGPGILSKTADYLRACGIRDRLALLTHPRLNELYGRPLSGSLRQAGYDVLTVLVPAAESSKSLRVAGRVYDALVDAHLDRQSALLALGGGVAGDLGGFVAATFLRGIRWVAVPTTLLAQADAGIGGKTAVNHARAKNIIGAVHQPSLVLADTETLASLPPRELRSGLAEVIKTGVIGDPELFNYLEKNLRKVLVRKPEALAYVVGRCARYKAGVVAADEHEEAGRMVLNYGHTVGHGIEAASGYRGVTHGEAVAAGMAVEAALAVRLGICEASLLERLTRLLRRAGLPARLGRVRRGRPPAREAVVAAMTHDKKARGGRLRFVLPAGIGQTVVRDDVPSKLLEEVLADGG